MFLQTDKGGDFGHWQPPYGHASKLLPCGGREPAFANGLTRSAAPAPEPMPYSGTAPLANFAERLRAIVRIPSGPHGLLECLAVCVVLACTVYFVWLCGRARAELLTEVAQRAATQTAPGARGPALLHPAQNSDDSGR
jgi:hypothetical protein